MNSQKRKQHTIDFIFPISLFFVFASSALVVLLLAANIYQNTTETTQSHFETETALAYITEKIHQSDADGADSIYLDTFDGCQALVMEENYGDIRYKTYIYEDDGYLRELFAQDGIELNADTGTKIMEVSSFEMETVSDGLYRFTCTSQDGDEKSTLVNVHSR
jgi:hypothetical protein